MKTLKLLLTGILFTLLIPICHSQTRMAKEQIFTLQSVSKNTTGKLLSESKEILLRRLKDMNVRNFQIIQHDAKSELVVTVTDTIDRAILSDILLSNGHLNFFETIDRQEVLKTFGKEPSGCIREALTRLYLGDSNLLRSESILGFAEAKDTVTINECFSSDKVKGILPGSDRLLWSKFPFENKQHALYCVSSSEKIFDEQDISEVHSDFGDPRIPVLCLTFKAEIWKSWQDFTKRNINKPVAIVLDNKVYVAPRLRDEIPHGQISLTGNGFSKMEIRKLVTIISNGVPLKFVINGNK